MAHVLERTVRLSGFVAEELRTASDLPFPGVALVRNGMVEGLARRGNALWDDRTRLNIYDSLIVQRWLPTWAGTLEQPSEFFVAFRWGYEERIGHHLVQTDLLMRVREDRPPGFMAYHVIGDVPLYALKDIEAAPDKLPGVLDRLAKMSLHAFTHMLEAPGAPIAGLLEACAKPNERDSLRDIVSDRYDAHGQSLLESNVGLAEWYWNREPGRFVLGHRQRQLRDALDGCPDYMRLIERGLGALIARTLLHV